MPRIINSGRNVDAWAKKNKTTPSNWDVCQICMKHGRHGLAGMLAPYQKGEPAGWGGRGDEQEHLTYKDSKLRCAVCASELTEEDDR